MCINDLLKRQTLERNQLRHKHRAELEQIKSERKSFRKHTKEVFSNLTIGQLLSHTFRDGSVCTLIVEEPNVKYTCERTGQTVYNVRDWIRKQTGGVDYNPIHFFGLEPWPKKQR